MPQELYNRVCQVKVGQAGGPGLLIEGLRIAFDVRKSVGSESNKATVQVWNLAASTRGTIQEKRTAVELAAGYEGLVEDLYSGQVLHVSHPRTGEDVVTVFECGDGAETFKSAQIDRTFRQGTPVTDVIKAVAAQLAAPVEEDAEEPLLWGPKPKAKKTSPIALRVLDADLLALNADLLTQGIPVATRRALTVSGNAKDVLDKLGLTYRFDWSVQDGVFQLMSFGRSLAGETVVLTPSSGLIGDPAPTEVGVKLLAFLIPQLQPGMALVLDSRTLKGTYRIEHVGFVGDTHSDQWTAEVEARTLPGLV